MDNHENAFPLTDKTSLRDIDTIIEDTKIQRELLKEQLLKNELLIKRIEQAK